MGCLAVILLCILDCAPRAVADVSPDTLTLSQVQLGNIFKTGETVRIGVQTTGDSVSWTVTDFWGVASSGGPVRVNSNGATTIQPGLGRLGCFALRVTATRQGAAVATADTAFAMLAPVDVSGMADSPFGVCTHFAQGYNTDVMPLIARAGIAKFRDEQYWQAVEPALTSPPAYVFPAYFQAYMAAAAAQGLTPVIEFDFENTNYDGGNTPYTPAGNAGYANYGVGVLNHYAPQIKEAHIWNEYNGSYCKGPAIADKPKYYAAMLKAAYTAIKAQHPEVQVSGGACVPMPLPWFQDLFANGAQDYLDAIDIHPYVAFPEGVETNLGAIQSLSAQYNHGAGPKPLWATECGYTDRVNPGRQTMASYLVRLLTIMRTCGVERAFWYLMADDVNYSSGLLRGPNDPLGPYAPSTGYAAYANLIQQLYGAKFVQREATDPRTRVYQFSRLSDKAPLRVAWSAASTAQLLLAASAPLTLINIMGEATTLQPVNGMIALSVDINPVYLIGQVDGIQEVGRDKLVADSAADFSSTQGAGPGAWFYGYYDGDISAYGDSYLSSAFKPMTWARTENEYAWTAPYYAALVDGDGAHPSSRPVAAGAYAQVWSVRRWQSNLTGTAHLVGNIRHTSPFGDGNGVLICVDGKPVYSTTVAGNDSLNFDFTTPIRSGSNLDFIVTCGSATDVNYDYVAFPVKISVSAPPPTTYSAWQSQYFTAAEITDPAISGDAATPAGDGVPNLLKYAANLHPKVPSSQPITAGSLDRSTPGAVYQTLTYRMAEAASDLTFTTEVNPGDLSNLSSWTAGGQIVGVPIDNGDGAQWVTVRDDQPINAAHPRRFMRLRVTRQ